MARAPEPLSIRTGAPGAFDAWYQRFRGLAAEHDLLWLAPEVPGPQHRAAFESGADPEDELNQLASMSEWRGCGCGGGG